MKESKKYSLNKEDLIKIGKGALIVIIGCVLTYLAEIITQIDFGKHSVEIAGIVMILINIIRKYLVGKNS